MAFEERMFLTGLCLIIFGGVITYKTELITGWLLIIVGTIFSGLALPNLGVIHG